MARDIANIRIDTWTSQDFRDCTEAEQRLYFLLLTHDTLTYAGVADWRPKRLAPLAADTSTEHIEATGYGLQQKRFILIDEHTEEVLIRSFLKHDGLLKQPRLTVSMANAYGSTASPELRKVISHELGKLNAQDLDWVGLKHDRIQGIIREPSAPIEDFISPKSRPTFGPNFPQDLGLHTGAELPLNGGQGLGLHTSTATSTTTPSIEGGVGETESFEDWWSIYPRKIGKGQARKAFRAALKKTDLDTLTSGVEAYAESVSGKDQQYIAHPATWLNGERWDDEQPSPESDQPRHPDAPDNRTVFELSDEEYAERERIHRERLQAKREAAAAGRS